MDLVSKRGSVVGLSSFEEASFFGSDPSCPAPWLSLSVETGWLRSELTATEPPGDTPVGLADSLGAPFFLSGAALDAGLAPSGMTTRANVRWFFAAEAARLECRTVSWRRISSLRSGVSECTV